MLALSAVVALLGGTGCSPQNDLFERSKEAVRHNLKDPESAQFRDVGRCGASDFVFGEVNGKNSYGAYTGFKSFYSDGVVAAADVEDLEWDRLFRGCMVEMARHTAQISGKPFNEAAEVERLNASFAADDMEVPMEDDLSSNESGQ
ncbi:hypothetical protein [Sphingomonas sp. ABOLF]|uniref:hypothetical protein n=1 Tax=Sphingomonas sp. ABOLF TaxID=1985879 RepID=UPI0019CFA65A|nr:hypothetical protein [Sphingomonas sp. ABOLF]